jgi:NAD(P)-dependent dehydrogenase (short-subunit alcohol dehydrogenase family)
MRRLKNKTAIITGGTRGLGKAISELFAEEGAAVFILDSDEQAGAEMVRGIRKRDGSGVFIRTDASSEEETTRSVRLAAEENQRVDILCNAASLIVPWHSAMEASPSEWERCIAVSLLGPQYATRAVLPFMIRQKSGSIINLSSVQGLVGGRNSVAETTVKSGLLGFTRSVAVDYGPFNIRANALCPGAIQDHDVAERAEGRTFLGRRGEPHEVAYAALFLASDEASYITGVMLPVDGGWMAQ